MQRSPNSLPRDDLRPTARPALALVVLVILLGAGTALALGVVLLVAWVALGTALG